MGARAPASPYLYPSLAPAVVVVEQSCNCLTTRVTSAAVLAWLGSRLIGILEGAASGGLEVLLVAVWRCWVLCRFREAMTLGLGFEFSMGWVSLLDLGFLGLLGVLSCNCYYLGTLGLSVCIGFCPSGCFFQFLIGNLSPIPNKRLPFADQKKLYVTPRNWSSAQGIWFFKGQFSKLGKNNSLVFFITEWV